MNRRTLTTYTPVVLVATLTAVNAATGDQTTTYVYGSTLAESGIASSLLKVQEIYPDSEDEDDAIFFAYNRQSEVIQKTDQNGTVHVYDRDKLARPTHDRVTALGSGVDGAVRRISTNCEVRGMAEKVAVAPSQAVTNRGLNRPKRRLTPSAFCPPHRNPGSWRLRGKRLQTPNGSKPRRGPIHCLAALENSRRGC